jgi:erythromycin esterase-like protein
MARGSGDEAVLEGIREAAVRLKGDLRDYDRLLDEVGDARYVLIGDGTHGTDEFYRERALITRRLVAERGFTAVAVEADWPDAYRANRYARGLTSDQSAEEALGDFQRFPTWMWRNEPVVEFLHWLREYNDTHHEPWSAVGFYGLDLYSLHASTAEVVNYLQARDPEAAARARARYACFERANGGDAQLYGYLAAGSPDLSCEKEVVEQLVELLEARGEYAAEDAALAEDEFFFAEQNARLARNAEAYYRTMYRGGVSSWNLRDQHMAQTLEALDAHLSQRLDSEARIVVWAHNSHLGDARATSMGRAGEWNLGQLVREAHPHESFLVGFTTYDGEVTAANDWDGPPERRRVRPALPDSYEALFHRAGVERFYLSLRDPGEALGGLSEERLERMIGVLYRPRTERQSHYFHCGLLRQFDAVVHLDRTSALRPLEVDALWTRGEAPETYPFGL